MRESQQPLVFTFTEVFALVVRNARREADPPITGSDLAARLGRSQPWWSCIETGRSTLDPAQIIMVCDVLGLHPGELFDRALEQQRRLEAEGHTVLMRRRPHNTNARRKLGLTDDPVPAAASPQ